MITNRGLSVFFYEDVENRIVALRQNSERILQLAECLGANPEGIALIRAAIMGTLDDVAASFGVHEPVVDFVTILSQPTETTQYLDLSEDKSFWP